MHAGGCHLDDTSFRSLHNVHCYYPRHASCADWPGTVAYDVHLGLHGHNYSFVRHRYRVHLHAAVNCPTVGPGLGPEHVIAPVSVAVAAVNNISCAT